ncbi:hypothetical protein ACFC0K_15670 [Streptomyces hydrogenans]|uniref:hypothetical protein n=1 Tax=Streptomyces hydrogenans TaxID=1873719 RepID=UPI0035E2F3E8
MKNLRRNVLTSLLGVTAATALLIAGAGGASSVLADPEWGVSSPSVVLADPEWGRVAPLLGAELDPEWGSAPKAAVLMDPEWG